MRSMAPASQTKRADWQEWRGGPSGRRWADEAQKWAAAESMLLSDSARARMMPQRSRWGSCPSRNRFAISRLAGSQPFFLSAAELNEWCREVATGSGAAGRAPDSPNKQRSFDQRLHCNEMAGTAAHAADRSSSGAVRRQTSSRTRPLTPHVTHCAPVTPLSQPGPSHSPLTPVASTRLAS